ncbi:hypothetical protein CQA16_25305, partial [Enterobacter hormaechei]
MRRSELNSLLKIRLIIGGGSSPDSAKRQAFLASGVGLLCIVSLQDTEQRNTEWEVNLPKH